jgi:hypothetical protein
MALGLATAMSMSACGGDDSGRRDQFYGTDVGANYQLPDGFLDRMPDTGGADAGDAVLDAAPDDDAPSGGVADAPAFQDAGEAADAETGG